MSVLDVPVHVGEGTTPFGELTLAQVRARAQELHDAVGFGPTARVAPVARAWTQLAGRMERAGAATVRGLGAAGAAELAERLWVTPPGGSLLSPGGAARRPPRTPRDRVQRAAAE